MNKKNKQGQVWAVFIIIGIFLMIVLFSTIDIWKESLDTARQRDNLNCRDVDDFDEVAYENQTDSEKLSKRPTCFVTGISMFWFMAAYIFAVIVWIVKQTRRKVR